MWVRPTEGGRQEGLELHSKGLELHLYEKRRQSKGEGGEKSHGENGFEEDFGEKKV